MKPTHRNPLLRSFVLASTICLTFGQAAHAASIYWDGAANAAWNTAANWSTASGAATPDPAAEPGANDDVIFNVTTNNAIAQIVTLNGNKNALSLTFDNTLTSLLRSSDTNTRVLSLGTGGLTVNSGAGAVTIGAASNGNQISLSGSQTWINNSSNTATIYNTIARSNGSVLNFSPGTSTFTATNHALTNNLVGTWAATGSGTSLRYVTKTSNVIGAYSAGTAAATAADLTSIAGTVNYDLADATGTTPADFNGNTIRFTGGAGTLAPGATSFIVRGLMNAGTGKWTIGTNPITIGGTNELVIIANSQDTEISSDIFNNGATASAVSYYGAGTLTLSGNNSFTNGLNIGAGKVLINSADALNSSTANVITFNGTSGTLALNGNDGLTIAGINSAGTGTTAQANQIVENANASAINLNIGGVSTNSTFYGVLRNGTGGGALGITKVGNGTLTLAGANTYTGTTSADEGTLASTLTTALPGYNVSGKVVFNGGTISVRTGDGTTTGWSMAQLDTLVSNATKTNGALGIDTTTASVTRSTDLNLGVLGLTKLGANTLTLSVANTYSGPTTVAALANNELIIQNAGSLGSTAGDTTVLSGGRLVLDGGITVTGEAATLSGNGGNFNGPLQSKSGVNKWTGDITIAANDTRIGAQAGSSMEVSGVIDSGASAHLVTFRPADTTATVIVSGANTYVGPTTITGGLVTVSSINSVSGGTASSNLGAPSAGNGTIKFGAAEGSGLKYIGTGEITDRAIDLAGSTHGGRIDQSGSGLLKFTSAFTATGAGSKTLTLQGSTAGTGEVGGAIVDNSGTNKTSLIKAGTGTWTLSGTNSFTGTTAVNGGTLKLNYGAGGTDTNKLSDTAALTLGGGTLELAGGTHPEIVASTTLTAGTASKVTRSSGSAVLQMNAITRGAGASIDFGASNIATTDATNTNGILGTWATINGSDWAANSTNAADGLITAPVYTNLDNDDIIADGAATNVRINSNGAGGSMTLGTSPVTINSLLQANASQAATINPGSTDILRTNGIMIGTAAKGLTIGSVADDGILTSATAGGDLLLSNNSLSELLTINSSIENNTSASSLTKVGAGTVILAGSNIYTGATNIAEGTLKAGSSTAFDNTSALVMTGTSTLDLNGNDAAFTNLTATSTNTITTTGAGSGVDTLTISALTAPTGALFTDGPTRQLAVSTAGGSGSPLTNVGNTFSGGLAIGSLTRITVVPGTVGSPGAIVSGPFGRGAITVNGGNVQDQGAQIWFATSNRTLVNDVIVNGNGGMGFRYCTFRIGTSNTTLVTGVEISGNIDANLADAYFGSDSTADGNSLLLSGQLTGNSGFRFFLAAADSKWTATLNNTTGNPSDYAGNTTINNKTTVKLGAANQIPNGTGKGDVTITLGTLDLNGFNETINGLSGTGVIDNVTSGTTNTLTLGDEDTTGLAFSGTIKNTTGTLSLVKIGTGTQTLSGPNTYGGTTTISDGTLLVNGNQSLATGNVQVDGTLGGTGTLGGAVTVSATGTIAPGASTGEITVPSANLSAGGTLAIEIDDTATPKVDKLTVTGALNVTNAKLDFTVTGTPAEPTYVIATGTITGSIAPGNVTGLPVGYNLVQTASEIKLVEAGGSDYETWGGPYGLAAGSEGGDLDNDGLTNFEEYAFGLIPDSGSSVNPITQQLNKSTGEFKYTRRATPATTGVTYTYESSTTLSGAWSAFTPDSANSDSGTPNEVITVNVPDALLTNPKVFIRVKAVK